MSTAKTVLAVLALLVAYGVVGLTDYEDALLLDQYERNAAIRLACLRSAIDPPPQSPPRGSEPAVVRAVSSSQLYKIEGTAVLTVLHWVVLAH